MNEKDGLTTSFDLNGIEVSLDVGKYNGKNTAKN